MTPDGYRSSWENGGGRENMRHLLADARVSRLRDEAEATAALDGTAADVKARLVVGPYLAEAEETPEGLKATSARERIRASRLPTITPDVGSWTGRIAG